LFLTDSYDGVKVAARFRNGGFPEVIVSSKEHDYNAGPICKNIMLEPLKSIGSGVSGHAGINNWKGDALGNTRWKVLSPGRTDARREAITKKNDAFTVRVEVSNAPVGRAATRP
jgi:hypothetical protein